MGTFFIPLSSMTKKTEHSTNGNNPAHTLALCLSKFHNHNSIMSIESLAEHLVKWTQIWGGGRRLWVTWHLFCELPACVSTYPGQCQPPDITWYCMDGSSSGLTMLSVCLHVITPFWHLPPMLLPSSFSRPTLSPSPRFSLAPHPSRCQALVHYASPLALWPGLPSNNFISFPPLSRRPAPPLTIGCCFLPDKKKKHRATWGRLRTQQ